MTSGDAESSLLLRSVQVEANGFEQSLVVERIVILGLAAPNSRVSATMEPSGQPLDVSWGPVLLKPNLPDAALVVRKPEVSIAEEWSIRFK